MTFKILAVENAVNHNGQPFTGFLVNNGEDLTFSSFQQALEFLAQLDEDFLADFNTFQVVKA